MSKYTLIISTIILLLCVAFLLVRTQQQLTPLQQAKKTSLAAGQKIIIPLYEQNKSGESGTAILSDVNGKILVSLHMAGNLSPISQPAHIHNGSCPKPGSVKYPLGSVQGGKSDTVIDASLIQLKKQLPLAINVHKSINEVSVYVSCGDIKL